VDFLIRLAEIRKHMFKPSIIRSAFQKAGLIPFKPTVVFNKLTKFSVLKQLETPNLDYSDSDLDLG
jgi:hypothetical protein